MSQSFPVSGNSSQPVVGLDVIRIAAAILVMLLHYGFWSWAPPTSYAIRTYGPGLPLPQLQSLTHFGWVGVEIFFVLSGLLIAGSANGASAYSFLKGRLVRLVPGAFICATLTLLVIWGGSYKPLAEIMPPYLRSILFIPVRPWVDSTYWTLGVETAFYAVLFLMLFRGRFGRLLSVIGVLGVGSSIFWVAFNLVHALPSSTPFTRAIFDALADAPFLKLLLLQHACLFALGVYIWFICHGAPRIRHYVVIAILMVGCVLEINGNNIMRINFVNIPLNPIPAIFTWLLAVALIIASIRYNSRLPVWVHTLSLRQWGYVTYIVYLLHNNLGLVVFKKLIASGHPAWGSLILTGIFIFALSFLISQTLEKYLQHHLRNILEKVQVKLQQNSSRKAWFIKHGLNI